MSYFETVGETFVEMFDDAPGSGVRQMFARFGSTCSACGSAIHTGDEIRYVKGLVATHERCGDPDTEPLARAPRGNARRTRNRQPLSYIGGRSSGYTFVRCTHEDYPCCGCGQ